MNVTLTGNLLKEGRLLYAGAVLEVRDAEAAALIKQGVALAVTAAPVCAAPVAADAAPPHKPRGRKSK